MGYPIEMPYDATGEYYKTGVMNYPLGGAFNSRINLNLREDKGWSYGAGGGFDSTIIPGVYMAGAGVKKEPTAEAVFEMMKEISNYKTKGITEEELSFTKNSMGQAEALEYETPYDKLSLLNRILEYDLPKGFNKEQQNILNSLTRADVDALAKSQLKTDNMVIVVVGDKKTVWDGLNKLGYPVIEVDTLGNPVN